jgi:hypothetical protein
MRVKLTPFLLVTAIVEIGAGLFLLIVPDQLLALLFGAVQSTAETLLVGRWVGVALLAIGVASAMARDDRGSQALRGVLVAVLLYDIAAVVLLAYAALGVHLAGPALWPAVVLHTVLALWCIWGLRTLATP